MPPITALLYCYKLASINLNEFRTYIEDTHVPLVRSLLRDAHPTTHTRYYVNKESGFMLGSPTPDEADLIAVITYDSQEHLQESMNRRTADGTRQVIEADEDNFMDRSKVRVVVLGPNDIGRSSRV